MHGAREFRLVLCANASDRMVKYATEMLENLGEAERAKGAGLPPLRTMDHRSSPRYGHPVLVSWMTVRNLSLDGPLAPAHCDIRLRYNTGESIALIARG